MDKFTLTNSIYQSILDLATEEGINASSRNEIYGCIFGRDSAITILKILRVVSNNTSFDHTQLLEICKRSLLNLTRLQGKEFNIESGEEPGKFIHEFRREKYEHLVNRPRPWFVYADKTLRNYDSIDSTPLGLIAIYRYWRITQDEEFLKSVMPSVEAGLNWMINYGDLDRDYLLEYKFHENRKHGGLVVQSWTDSRESHLMADGSFPKYPIAPVEVQGYAWLALKLWADFYRYYSCHSGEESGLVRRRLQNQINSDLGQARTKGFWASQNDNKMFAKKINNFAKNMKAQFNEKFVFKEDDYFFVAQALDGDKNQIKTVTGNPLLLLWASYKKKNKTESILEAEYVKEIVNRSFKEDLFDKEAGIRTMSVKSPTFNPNANSYHNGSFWPKLNGMSHEGLYQWGFMQEADLLKEASLKPIYYFGTPIELYIKSEEGYLEYSNSCGQKGCRVQAWSAAAILDLLTV